MVWLRELERQLYLWLTQEGILLLICTYLSCSTSTPLSPFPLPMSSASLTLSSCTKKEVLLTEMLLFLSCEESVVVMVRSLVALLCCPRIGSSVNSLISGFQTAGKRESHFWTRSIPTPLPNMFPKLFLAPALVNACHWATDMISWLFRGTVSCQLSSWKHDKMDSFYEWFQKCEYE